MLYSSEDAAPPDFVQYHKAQLAKMGGLRDGYDIVDLHNSRNLRAVAIGELKRLMLYLCTGCSSAIYAHPSMHPLMCTLRSMISLTVVSAYEHSVSACCSLALLSDVSGLVGEERYKGSFDIALVPRGYRAS